MSNCALKSLYVEFEGRYFAVSLKIASIRYCSAEYWGRFANMTWIVRNPGLRAQLRVPGKRHDHARLKINLPAIR